MTGMLCPERIDLEKRRDSAFRYYMELLNPQGMHRVGAKQGEDNRMTKEAEKRYQLLDDELHTHKGECKVCTSL